MEMRESRLSLGCGMKGGGRGGGGGCFFSAQHRLISDLVGINEITEGHKIKFLTLTRGGKHRDTSLWWNVNRISALRRAHFTPTDCPNMLRSPCAPIANRGF